MTHTIPESSRDQTEQAVTRFFHMCNSHCPGNIAPLMTQDVELVADESAQGQDGVNAYFVRLWDAYPELTFRVENTIVNHTGAAVEVAYENGPNGRGARCIVFHMRAGLIRRVRFY
jgi:predicted ester cyclase